MNGVLCAIWGRRATTKKALLRFWKNAHRHSQESNGTSAKAMTNKPQDIEVTFAKAPASRATIAIVGSGMMGAGIAQLAAVAGYRVVLYDILPEALTKAVDTLKISIQKLVERRYVSADEGLRAVNLVTPVQSLVKLKDADMVIEAVAEDLQVKRSLFRNLEAVVSRECILASNTSSLSITAIASDLKYPERVVGMHFFNPVQTMQLVEGRARVGHE